MIRFECDYAEGMHPKILEKVVETNMQQTIGYSEDEYCQSARKKIQALCNNDKADVHYFVGGTQINLTVIAGLLRPHQGVLSSEWGHIAVHECGAIETTGHKVLILPSEDGKVTPNQVDDYCEGHITDSHRQHMVQPAMLYVSQPTENGTVYSLKELQDLHASCKRNNLNFYIDGARLGYAMATEQGKMTLEELSNACDIFYIGATKIGAIFGEALVIPKESLQEDFRYLIKNRGALLAKGRFLGIQFDVLFTDNLYFDISQNAVDLALEIKKAFEDGGFKFLFDSPSNQQFPILPNKHIEKLKEKYAFHVWQKMDNDTSAVRIVTSWVTNKEHVDEFVKDIKALS